MAFDYTGISFRDGIDVMNIFNLYVSFLQFDLRRLLFGTIVFILDLDGYCRVVVIVLVIVLLLNLSILLYLILVLLLIIVFLAFITVILLSFSFITSLLSLPALLHFLVALRRALFVN